MIKPDCFDCPISPGCLPSTAMICDDKLKKIMFSNHGENWLWLVLYPQLSFLILSAEITMNPRILGNTETTKGNPYNHIQNFIKSLELMKNQFSFMSATSDLITYYELILKSTRNNKLLRDDFEYMELCGHYTGKWSQPDNIKNMHYVTINKILLDLSSSFSRPTKFTVDKKTYDRPALSANDIKNFELFTQITSERFRELSENFQKASIGIYDFDDDQGR